MALVCHGKTGGPVRASGDHCCYVNGQTCPYLLDADGGRAPKPKGRDRAAVEGRRFSCALRVELGSWAAVHADPRYLADVQPAWGGRFDCGDWGPAQGQCCYAQPEVENAADAAGVAVTIGPGSAV